MIGDYEGQLGGIPSSIPYQQPVGLYWGNIKAIRVIMKKKMETIGIIGYVLGLYCDKQKATRVGLGRIVIIPTDC